MAPFKSYSLQASSILLVVLLIITPSLSVNVSKGVINDICSKTQNPSFCLQLLNSNPGASKADLRGLAKITINLASSSATKTLQLIHSLIPRTTDVKLKERYSTCSEHYNNVIGDLADAQKDLTIGDPLGVNLSASASMDEASDCEDELKGLPADPSVHKGNKDLNNIASIILVISNLLPR